MDQLVRFAADGVLLIILGLAGVFGIYYLMIKTRSFSKVLPYAIMSGLSSLLIAKLISLVYQPSEARPYLELGKSAGAAYIDNPGFPSDHALLATVVVVMLAVLTPYKKVSLALGILLLVMGIARVLALVHTPLDVIGGIVIGCIGAVWYLQMKPFQYK